MNIKTETREVTKTKTFVTFNSETNEEVEFEMGRVIDFLESLMGTDGFMTGVKNLDYSDRELAEALEEEGLIARTYSAGWHEKDEDRVNELWETCMEEYMDYDDIDASTVR